MNNDQNIEQSTTMFSETQVDFMNTIRMLWEQHSVWTKSAILSLVYDLPNVDSVVARLLSNPDDFEQALQPYYGEPIASFFGELLTEHLVVAAELVKAVKAGEEKEAAQLESIWYDNADAIAEFLGGINPYWSQEEWRDEMHNHLALVKEEAVTLLTGQHDDSVSLYDEIEIQALGMADMMAQGMIRQFDIE